MLNNKKYNSLLLTDKNNLITVVSILLLIVSLKSKTTELRRFLGTNYASTIAVELEQAILKDILRKVISSFSGAITTLDLSTCTESAPLTVPLSFTLVQVPVCLPLFRKHAIMQGRADNKTVTNSVHLCYPLCLL